MVPLSYDGPETGWVVLFVQYFSSIVLNHHYSFIENYVACTVILQSERKNNVLQ